jgi:hypothetical protein
VNFNVVLPFLSSTLSFVFFLFLVDQWRDRRKPYQAIWAAGMLWYALSAGTEWIGGAFGWSEPLYRLWYLIGAIWVAGWLGLGTVYLLGRTRFGYAFAFSLFLAGLFTFLTQAKYDYPQSGIAPVLYFLVAMLLAAGVVVLSFRRSARWPALAAAAIVGGSVVSAAMVARVTLPAPGWVVDPVTHIPTGDLFPGYIRLLTPFFNITGAFALSLGAIYSAYVFMPKRRLVRYELRRDRGVGFFVRNLLLAPVAITVNFVASLPGAFRALFAGRINSRVPATILIAIGGIIPAITSGMNRFGATSGFFVGELLGVVFLFAGFLVSIEVFREVRVPFTAVVLWNRRAEEAS